MIKLQSDGSYSIDPVNQWNNVVLTNSSENRDRKLVSSTPLSDSKVSLTTPVTVSNLDENTTDAYRIMIGYLDQLLLNQNFKAYLFNAKDLKFVDECKKVWEKWRGDNGAKDVKKMTLFMALF